jgi:cob(I)alamin adenosyltransferase
MSGLIYVFTGEGKGKTSAALGVAIRAAGHDKQVVVFQFMKAEAPKKGEYKAVEPLENINIYRFGGSPLSKNFNEEETRAKIGEGLDCAISMLAGGCIDVLILDEINTALSKGLASTEKVKEILEYKKNGVDIIITGRNAPEEILEAADLITEMKKIKHPFDKGVKAKKGLDY